MYAIRSYYVRWIGAIGEQALYVLEDLGRMGVFLFWAILGVFKRPFRFRELLKQLRFIGAGSLTVIFFTALSSGMVLGLQGYYSLHKFGAEGMLGSAVSLTLIMELGPVLTALMVTGRAGSAMCADRITSYNVCYTKLLRERMTSMTGFSSREYVGSRNILSFKQ